MTSPNRKSPISIAILGSGRMGAQVLQAVEEAGDCTVAGIWSREARQGADSRISADLTAVLASADAAIDFTLPEATDEVLQSVEAAAVPLVCGVSGLSPEQTDRLQGAALKVPLLYDRNMSLGIAVLTQLVRQAGRALGPPFCCEIHETHHVHKIDAPSGTALQLGEALAESRGQRFDEVFHYRPDDESGPVPTGSINFRVTRRGEVPGDHSVEFRTPSESVSLSHSVTDRRVFADGALHAAKWLVSQPPGRYRMADALGS